MTYQNKVKRTVDYLSKFFLPLYLARPNPTVQPNVTGFEPGTWPISFYQYYSSTRSSRSRLILQTLLNDINNEDGQDKLKGC